MIRSIAEFLRYFDAVHRRTMRDVAALPPEAEAWRPPRGRGEASWDIPTLVGHIAGSRLYFVSAYRGEGWVSPPKPDTRRRERWLPVLEESAAQLRAALADTPDEWLDRRVRMIDTEGTLSGWRILMMMLEHEVHHRSQIDAYAGLEGWPVPDIFGRSAEAIAARQSEQRALWRGEQEGA
ncbi:hypothetical protein HRbin29_00186 [bacterium HR29]|jgi:uncharacterized damage-inducible protein DinB|nr:hypothetical protein HRbin29_00186 [bacterium HR29]